MKKNLKKAAALALAALTVSSMTAPAFAATKAGDIDGSGILTANDAALVISYAKALNKTNWADTYGGDIVDNLKSVGLVSVEAIEDGEPDSKDAVRILAKVTTGASFAELIEKDLEDYVDSETNESTLSYEVLAAVTAVVESLTESQSVVFTYGKSAMNVSVDTDQSVIDALGEALGTSSAYVQAKGAALLSVLGKFSIDGVSLKTEEGWKAFGSLIGADATAFAALYPETVDSTYISNFTSNIDNAFSGTYTDEIDAAIKAYTGSSYDVALTVTDNEETTYSTTDAAKALAYLVENVLYANDKKASEYPDNITLKVGDNTAVVKVVSVTQ